MLGFTVAFLGLDFYRSSAATGTPVLSPLLVAALPLLDAVLAVLHRLLRRASPLYGDRRHFYDLLLLHGWSQRKVALTACAITAGLGFVGERTLRMRVEDAIFLSALVLGALLASAIRLGSLRGAGVEKDSKVQEARM